MSSSQTLEAMGVLVKDEPQPEGGHTQSPPKLEGSQLTPQSPSFGTPEASHDLPGLHTSRSPSDAPQEADTNTRQTSSHVSPGASPQRTKRPRLSRNGTDIDLVLSQYQSQVPEDHDEQAAGPTVRLVIRKLVLENFKSYKGRQEIGPFNDSFSAVVGPNGSGKSNVIDSLLFVFGFKSNKLRQANQAGLIHKSNGVQEASCCVEVHFEDTIDHGDGTSERVPDSAMVVSRTLKFKSYGRDKTTSSKYHINGKEVSFKDMAEMLQGRGIDLTHKRFLILQGEVESIAMMKPKAEQGEEGLLEYLEDIIGTAKHVESLNELQQRMDNIQDEVLEAQTVFNVAKDQLNMSDKARQKCLDAYTHANEAATAKHTLHRHKIYQLNLQHHIAGIEGDEARAALAALEAENAGVEDQIKALTASIATLTKSKESSQSSVTSFEKQISVTKVELTKAEASLSHMAVRRTKLSSEIDKGSAVIDRNEGWLRDFDSDMAALQTSIDEHEAGLEAASAQLREIQRKIERQTAPITAQIDEKQAEAEPWRVQLQNCKNEVANAELSIDDARQRLKSAETAASTTKERLSELGARGKALGLEERTLEKRLAQLRASEPETAAAQQQLESAQQRLQQARSAYSAANESASSAKSQSRIASELERYCRENDLTGFYGRLGALGTIPKQYDVAVSTASPRLDDFVTADMKTAQECIAFLREKRIGRATFICLDKMRQPNLQFTAPAESQRLFDLIKPRNAKFLPAFYHATGDTLVAADLQLARRIAFGGSRRFKTVTLKGEIVEVSGAMSGGGQPSRGRMSSVLANGASAAELAALQREVDAAAEELKQCESTCNAAEKEAAKHRTELERCEAALEPLKLKVAEAVQLFAEGKAAYEVEKEHLTTLRAKEMATIDTFQSQVTAQQDKTVQLEASSRELEEQIQALREQILDLGGTELREMDAKTRDARLRLKQLQAQQADKRAEKRNMTVTLSQARDDVAQARQALELLTKDAEKLETRAAKLRDDEVAAEQGLAKVQSEVLQLSSDLDDSKQKLDECRTAAGQFELEHQKLGQAVAACDAKRTALEKSIGTENSELDKLNLVDLSQFRDLRDESGGGPSVFEFSELSDEELAALSVSDIEALGARFDEEQRLFNEASPNTDEMVEYHRNFKEYRKRQDEFTVLDDAFQELRESHRATSERREREFLAGLKLINEYLKDMYKLITTGGNADLELVDSTNPFEGIEFTVMPPGKSYKNISNLSGGEKTLSSLSLVFALHKYKPTALYVMDEIDAALDIKNVAIIANYIRGRTRLGQFIVVTLRSHMFEMATRLIGVFKWHDCTKTVTYDPATV